MLYDIKLSISYDFASPAGAGRQVLRLMPATLPGIQRLILGDLAITPRPQERLSRVDFFGNSITEVAYREAHDSIDFTLTARVERMPLLTDFSLSPNMPLLEAELLAERGLTAASPHHFLSSSPRVHCDPQFTDFARSCINPDMGALDMMQAIGLALHNRMTFDPDATTVDTPPLDAFQRGKGVCQDFSHIHIACLRGIGIPAGYVSGFLRTKPPEGEARLEGADAMHAWVRAWCGAQLGWVEYDPTNAIWVGTDHIVVAHGRDYSDVAPVKGILRLSGSQTSKQAVDVIPVALAG